MPTPVILKLLALALAGLIALTPIQLNQIHDAGTANRIINKLERKVLEKAKEKGKPNRDPIPTDGIPYKEIFKHFGIF